jgi:hypothetical protein
MVRVYVYLDLLTFFVLGGEWNLMEKNFRQKVKKSKCELFLSFSSSSFFLSFFLSIYLSFFFFFFLPEEER